MAHLPALTIDSLTHGPWGLGRSDGKVVLVPMTVPGDQVAAEVVEEHKRYSVARAVSVLRPSPARRTAPCPYVGDCGGCPWQHVSHDAQLRAKQQNVADALPGWAGSGTSSCCPSWRRPPSSTTAGASPFTWATAAGWAFTGRFPGTWWKSPAA